MWESLTFCFVVRFVQSIIAQLLDKVLFGGPCHVVYVSKKRKIKKKKKMKNLPSK